MNNSNEIKVLEKNIISWYPFEDNSKMLCINLSSESIIKELKNKLNIVEQIENISNDTIKDQKYDYILIYGINKEKNKLTENLNYAKKHLNQNGTILLTCNNKYGLEKFNVDMDSNLSKQYYSKQEIENELKKQDILNYKFYYPLPNYKMPNVIFTDKRLPDSESILRDLTLYGEKEVIAFDERKKYIEIIEENNKLFTFFANSFFIEISEIENEIKYVSFNNSRKEKYRMNTIMKEEYVYKNKESDETINHFEQIIQNIEVLNKLGFNTLDKFENGYICSKIMPAEKQLDKILINYVNNNQYEDAIDLIQKYKEELISKLPIVQNEENNSAFNKYNIQISDELNKSLNYTKNGFYDLIFQNCFYVDDVFYFYDQEWTEENIPIEFIIYRAIEYLGNTSSKINKEHLFKQLRINDYISVFKQLEEKLQKEIKDETIWEIHYKNGISIHDLYYTKNHYNNLYNLKENENEELKKCIEGLEKKIEVLENKNTELTNELIGIKESRSWKLIQKIRKMKIKHK